MTVNLLNALLGPLPQKSLIKSGDLVMKSLRRLKVHEIAIGEGISSEQIHNLVHQHLNMRKLFTQ